MAFVVLVENPSSKVQSALPILTFDEASEMRWDAVMAAGAGFKNSTIKKFELFRKEQFGVRVQHVLNDQSRRDNFLSLNESFGPHVVVFNNSAWPAGSFTEFHAERFHVLPGAVDPVEFRPTNYRGPPLKSERWVVGGLANKNPAPLIEVLSKLPPNVVVRLYGRDKHGLARSVSNLIKAGRVELAGVLHGAELSQFYREVDCIVMTEESSGWANLAAESMASGVPLVCTPHGTASFAKHGETALVIDAPTPNAIAESVQRLMDDPELCKRLSVAARETIAAFSWESYARELLVIIRRDGRFTTPLHRTLACTESGRSRFSSTVFSRCLGLIRFGGRFSYAG